MNSKSPKILFIILQYLSDLLGYFLSFKVIQFYKYGYFSVFDETTIKFYIIPVTIFITSFVTRKFKKIQFNSFLESAKPFFSSFILTVGILTIYFNLFMLNKPSRLLFAGTITLGFMAELVYVFFSSKVRFNKKIELRFRLDIFSFIYHYLLLLWFILYVYFIMKSNVPVFEYDMRSLSVVFIIWLANGILTTNFLAPDISKNIFAFIWKKLKSNIIFVTLVSFSVYIMIPVQLSSVFPLYIAISYSVLALVVDTAYYIIKKPAKTDEVSPRLLRATEYTEAYSLKSKVYESIAKYHIDGNPYNPYLVDQLTNIYLRKFDQVYDFLDDRLDLFKFDFRRCIIIRTADMYNIDVLPDGYLEMYMNLHELNDIRRLNKYLIVSNQKLMNGGVLVGKIEPLELRRNRFLNSYPYYIALMFYFFDFVWKRVFPKMPGLKKFYFALTRGHNRVLSLSETIGRLYYSGYEVLDLQNIGNFIYFISRKMTKPKDDKEPSYGPLIKLKRVGKDGKIIKVYKFRTMYPYSEYLQNFVYEHTKLKEGGKFNDDFRITSWGKILRKLWLDELPMLINFLKGELKLVGVRPLSLHYFYLYSDELRDRRVKYKPGLVPPFYKDLPKTLDEIMDSEMRYLDAYDKHPLLTDTKYLFFAAYNIIIMKARSN